MKESKSVRGNCGKRDGVPVRKAKAGKSLSSELHGGRQERQDVGWRLVGPGWGVLQGHMRKLEFYPGWKATRVSPQASENLDFVSDMVTYEDQIQGGPGWVWGAGRSQAR